MARLISHLVHFSHQSFIKPFEAEIFDKIFPHPHVRYFPAYRIKNRKGKPCLFHCLKDRKVNRLKISSSLECWHLRTIRCVKPKSFEISFFDFFFFLKGKVVDFVKKSNHLICVQFTFLFQILIVVYLSNRSKIQNLLWEFLKSAKRLKGNLVSSLKP